jgi:16S rRNA pseudouridine516 synthase
LVYALLPERFLQRTPVMATVGRLDRDTSGLLLLTDDGALNHRLTSPRHHVAKCYHVTVDQPVPDAVIALFASGTLQLHGESTPCAPAPTERVTPTTLRVTLHEGRYHQVRRMCAAVGLHVTALHREAFGALTLGDLAPGRWRLLERDERDVLNGSRSAP